MGVANGKQPFILLKSTSFLLILLTAPFTLASAFYVASKPINCYVRAFLHSQFLNKNIMINEIESLP